MDDCATTLHRVAAARGAMNGLMDVIFAAHLCKHLASPGLAEEERAAGAKELIAAIRRYAK